MNDVMSAGVRTFAEWHEPTSFFVYPDVLDHNRSLGVGRDPFLLRGLLCIEILSSYGICLLHQPPRMPLASPIGST